MTNYVIVGLGSRHPMFGWVFTGKYGDYSGSARILGICDKNPGRVKMADDYLRKANPDLKCYAAEDFDTMLSELRPDCVIVTTMDSFHDEYICKALEAGCDAITEKPMTIDAEKCQRIVDTVQRTGRHVRVSFNYRYAPPRSQVKELLMSGVIGKVLSVNFEWLLDTRHGADYFRRWHSSKANSGGLMVHKATHHFDLVNWWLSSTPSLVYAMGDRVFYNAEQAERYELSDHAERCLDCPVAGRCNFFLDLRNNKGLKEYYLDQEKYDGYLRDKCVFRDDIDIEDTMNLVVRYRSGAMMAYCLNAFMPWEGYRVQFNGTKGRLEHSCQENSYISGDGTVQGALKPEGTSIKIFPQFKSPYEVEVRRGEGGHGGGDEVMIADIFGDTPADPLKRAADYVQGAYSILTGVAANKSMATGAPVDVAELVTNLPEPDFPEMPGHNESIAYVPLQAK